MPCGDKGVAAPLAGVRGVGGLGLVWVEVGKGGGVGCPWLIGLHRVGGGGGGGAGLHRVFNDTLLRVNFGGGDYGDGVGLGRRVIGGLRLRLERSWGDGMCQRLLNHMMGRYNMSLVKWQYVCSE